MKSKDRTGNKGNADKVKVPRLKPMRRELVFSFRDFDPTQGQTFAEWEDGKLLQVFLDKLREYSRKTLPEAQQARLTLYETFPPESGFKHPSFIPDDARWASLHIQGKECVAGHFIDNVFYITFLDRNHQFWVTKLKHT
jgi:hypothetical protein